MKSNRPILEPDNTKNSANNLNQFNEVINSNPYNAAWFNTFFLPSNEGNGLVNEISPVNHQLDKPISNSKTTINDQSLATVKYHHNDFNLTNQSNKGDKKSNPDSAEKNNNHKKRKKNPDSDAKKELQKQNRENARAFRERQIEKVAGLEIKIEDLVKEETELNDGINKIKIENLSLIQQRDYYRNILSQSTIFYKKEAHNPENASGQNNLVNSTAQHTTLQNSKKK